MSDAGESQTPIYSRREEPRAPTSEDQAFLDKVKKQYEERTGTNPKEFLVVLVCTPLIGTINYLFKVYVGELTYSHLFVYGGLLRHAQEQEPKLRGFQLNKTMDDPLVFFRPEDEDDPRE